MFSADFFRCLWYPPEARAKAMESMQENAYFVSLHGRSCSLVAFFFFFARLIVADMTDDDRRQLWKEILAGEEFQRILPQGQRWTEELQQYLEELVSTRKGLRAGLNLPTEVHWLPRVGFNLPPGVHVFMLPRVGLNLPTEVEVHWLPQLGLDLPTEGHRLPRGWCHGLAAGRY